MAYLRKQPQPPLHRPLLARLLLWLADNDCNAGKRGRLRRLPLAAAASERAARRAREQGRPRRAGGAGRVGRGGARAHRGGRVCGRRRAGAAGGDLCRRRLAAGAGPLHHVWRAARGRPPVRVAAAGPPSLPGARKRGAARLARMARPRARAGAQRAPLLLLFVACHPASTARTSLSRQAVPSARAPDKPGREDPAAHGRSARGIMLCMMLQAAACGCRSRNHTGAARAQHRDIRRTAGAAGSPGRPSSWWTWSTIGRCAATRGPWARPRRRRRRCRLF